MNSKSGYSSGDRRKGNKPGSPGNRNNSYNNERGSYQRKDNSGEDKPFGKHNKKDARGSGRPKRPRIKRSSASSFKSDEEIRLNKFIANAGICSRREADELIKTGLISVNGKIVTEMGVKVKHIDEIKYNGERIRSEKKVYLLLNKPRDYVTTVSDPEGRKTVMDLIKRASIERVYPVGRLDRNTTGVLLFTNDGDLTTKLTHPKFEKKKIYHVFLNRDLSKADLEKIANGLELQDGYIKPDAINYVYADSKKEVGIEIHSGKKHIVRRIFDSLEYKVVRLDRVYFAGLTKKNLPRGKWRFLTPKEVNMLKMNAFE